MTPGLICPICHDCYPLCMLGSIFFLLCITQWSSKPFAFTRKRIIEEITAVCGKRRVQSEEPQNEPETWNTTSWKSAVRMSSPKTMKKEKPVPEKTEWWDEQWANIHTADCYNGSAADMVPHQLNSVSWLLPANSASVFAKLSFLIHVDSNRESFCKLHQPVPGRRSQNTVLLHKMERTWTFWDCCFLPVVLPTQRRRLTLSF